MEENKEKSEKSEFYKGRLYKFDAVGRFRSVWRAIKRGHVSPTGLIYPSRPFNNRKPTRGRRFNEDKKGIYGELANQGRIQ